MGGNKTWRAFEKGTASSLRCCGKPTGLPPCLGYGNRDVDALTQWQGKDQKPNLCSQCLIPCCHTLKITADRWIPAGRASLQITLTNNGFDQSRGTGMKHNPRALSPVVFLCSSEKEATSCIGKLATTAIRSSWILPLLCPTVNHCHEAVLSPQQLKTSSTQQLWASFSQAIKRQAMYEEENGVTRPIPKGQPWGQCGVTRFHLLGFVSLVLFFFVSHWSLKMFNGT